MSTRAHDLAPLDEPHAPPALRPRRRIPRTAVVAAAVIAAAAAFHYLWPASGSAPAGYTTTGVDRGPIEQTVNATGTVNPVTTVQVGTYVSGPILAIDVTFNSPVKKDQRVARIDPAPFAVKVREAEANLQNAKARVLKDQADLTLKKLLLVRNRALLTKNLVAQNDLDTAQSNYDQAVAQLALDQAAVAQAQASLEEAQVNLRYTDILSPVDGVVVSRNVDVGQTVAASFQTPTLFLIAQDLTQMQVDASVSESDIGGVKMGQKASFTVEAYAGRTFEGRVSQLRQAPITVQNVVTYDVVIAVANPDLALLPGMTANVHIVTEEHPEVLAVPLLALRFHPQGAATGPDGEPADGAKRVWVLRDRAPEPVSVQVGIDDGTSIEVTGG